MSPDETATAYGKGSIRVLAGCAPCQPFSSYAFKNKKKDPNKYDLLYEFGRLVKAVHPDIVTMENVAQILSFKEKPVLSEFRESFEKLNGDSCVGKSSILPRLRNTAN